MNVAEKCDGMTRLILKKERVENEKAESNREFNEELKQIDQDLLTIARERTDQMEISFPKAATGKGKKEDKKAAAGA